MVWVNSIQILKQRNLDTFLDTLSYRWTVKKGEKEWIKVMLYKDLKENIYEKEWFYKAMWIGQEI